MSIEPQLAKAATLAQPDFFSTAVRTFSTLCILLAVILLGSYLIRRFWPKSGFMSGDQWVRVIATSYLAPKKMISLVEVAGEMLVLGHTEQQISMLARITDRETIDHLKQSQRQRESAGLFGNPFKSMMPGRKDGKGPDNPLVNHMTGITPEALENNSNG